MQLVFPNLVGRHCSSSAVRSVLAYDGVHLSEAMVFGLGSGLGFFYRHEPDNTPTRRFNGRAPDLEGNVYTLIGQPLEWAGRWQPELITDSLKQHRPLLAQTNIHPIPYYDDAQFIGHGLAIIGQENNEIITADIASNAPSRMPLSAFHDAIATAHPPILASFHYASVPVVTHINALALAASALEKTVQYMLHPPTSHEGITAMQHLANDLPGWINLPDLDWAARFGYQSIEKRGTGGGNFRHLFADFLQEITPAHAIPATIIQDFHTAGNHWTQIATHLKATAFTKDPHEQQTHLNQAAALTQSVTKLELLLFEGLLEGLVG